MTRMIKACPDCDYPLTPCGGGLVHTEHDYRCKECGYKGDDFNHREAQSNTYPNKGTLAYKLQRIGEENDESESQKA